MSERERQIPYDITYMWNLKYDANEPIYKRETESQIQRTDLWLPRERGLRLTDGSFYNIEWINSKVLLYITENYMQYLMINHNRKEYKKGYICIYIFTHIYKTESQQ